MDIAGYIRDLMGSSDPINWMVAILLLIATSPALQSIANKARGVEPKPDPLVHILETIVTDVNQMKSRLSDLHEWHDVADPITGVRVGFIHKSLTTLDAMSKSMEKQEEILARQTTIMERQNTLLASLTKSIESLTSRLD